MDLPPSKTSPLKGKKDAEGCLSESSPSESSPEGGYSESSEEGSPIVKVRREGENFSPETATAERLKLMLHPTKRLRNHNGGKVRNFSPTSSCPTGTSYNIVTLSAPCPQSIFETELNPEISELNQGDELERYSFLHLRQK
ncbi:unnamed protein product [Dovyalis caffra]|uniref:Uncharacterized protein n=1 Tax=Dovyalis caffra TaxID=77055 RepID=A0AAV1SAT9_9ROSI|nr:unnamed protein product [Dovyalis caffra]